MNVVLTIWWHIFVKTNSKIPKRTDVRCLRFKSHNFGSLIWSFKISVKVHILEQKQHISWQQTFVNFKSKLRKTSVICFGYSILGYLLSEFVKFDGFSFIVHISSICVFNIYDWNVIYIAFCILLSEMRRLDCLLSLGLFQLFCYRKWTYQHLSL